MVFAIVEHVWAFTPWNSFAAPAQYLKAVISLDTAVILNYLRGADSARRDMTEFK